MTRFVVGEDRNQSTLFPELLDDYVGDDNPVQTKSLLSNERRTLVDELGFNEHDLHVLDETSVYAAFVEDATRRDFILRLIEKP